MYVIDNTVVASTISPIATDKCYVKTQQCDVRSSIGELIMFPNQGKRTT